MDMDAVIERLSGKHIMIATPIGDRPTARYAGDLLDTVVYLHQAGIKFYVKWLLKCSDLSYGRNSIVAEFLEGAYTDLIWIDDDMGWENVDFLRLLLSEHDFVGGMYRKKAQYLKDDDPRVWVVHVNKDNQPTNFNEPFEVDGLGTGFLKTSRAVFEKIIKARPTLKKPIGMETAFSDEPSNFYLFFHFDGYGNGEDFFLSKLYRSVGGHCYVDPMINLLHIGEYEYKGPRLAALEKMNGKL